MKKFLTTLCMFTIALGAPLFAHEDKVKGSEETESHEQMMKTMQYFINKLRGKTVSIPGNLAEEAMAVKSEMLREGADMLKEHAALNFKAKSSEAAQYEKAAAKLKEAADALEGLPVNKTMKKNFKNIDEFLELMYKKKALKARILEAIAKDLGDKEMEQKAKKFGAMVEKFKEELSEGSEEESEEATETGCPAGADQDEEEKESASTEEAEEATPKTQAMTEESGE